MITCSRKFEFDSAHRILNHESKCKMLHGHRYVLKATFTADNLDDIGRIIDYGIIKEILGNWIEKNLDHNTILNILDQELGNNIEKITDQKIYYLNYNPTAENIAKHIIQDICPLLFKNYSIKCIDVEIYETPNCSAQIKL